MFETLTLSVHQGQSFYCHHGVCFVMIDTKVVFSVQEEPTDRPTGKGRRGKKRVAGGALPGVSGELVSIVQHLLQGVERNFLHCVALAEGKPVAQQRRQQRLRQADSQSRRQIHRHPPIKRSKAVDGQEGGKVGTVGEYRGRAVKGDIRRRLSFVS